MRPNSILVCARGDQLRTTVEKALGESQRIAHVENPADALAAIRDGTVDLLVADGLTVSEALPTLRAASPGRPTPVIVVALADDIEARIAFLEAGADDVLGAGFDSRELEARVQALLIRYRRVVPSSDGGGGPGGQITAFFSPKGGVGTTTLAVNTALLLADGGAQRTLLIDLDLQFGQVATHLNLAPKFDLYGLASDDAALGDADAAVSYLTAHDSGVVVLAAPTTPDSESRIGVEQVERAVDTLRSRFDRVVVDCGSRLDQRVMAVLQRADTHIFVVSPELGALNAMTSATAFLSETVAVPARTCFVLNHLLPKAPLKRADVERLLHATVAVEVPYAELDMLAAVNEGMPIVLSRPSSQTTAALRQLSQLVLGAEAAADGAAPQRRRFFRRR